MLIGSKRRSLLATKKILSAPVITDPTQIANCVLWLDAADAGSVTIATGISQWRDKSGQVNHVGNGVGGNQPAYGSVTLNGHNTVTFNGASKSLASGTWSAGGDLSGGSTMFVVVRPNLGGDVYQPIVRFTSTNPTGLQHENITGGVSTDRLEGFVSAASTFYRATPTSIMTTAVWRMDMVVVDTGALTVTLQSNQVTIGGPKPFTGAISSTSTDTISVATDNSTFSTMDLAEVIIYKRPLTSGGLGEQSSVYNYLSSKWGISLGSGTP